VVEVAVNAEKDEKSVIKMMHVTMAASMKCVIVEVITAAFTVREKIQEVVRDRTAGRDVITQTAASAMCAVFHVGSSDTL
jgi:hypothetical protein